MIPIHRVRTGARWLFFTATLFTLLAPSATRSAGAAPPATRTDDVRETLHGVTIADPYRWLEDQTGPETRQWIDAQNAYTKAYYDSLPGRDRLRRRFTQLARVDAISAPVEANGVYFVTKRAAGQEQALLYKRQGLKGKDEVLVNPYALRHDHTTTVGLLDVTPDAGLIAYFVRQGGEDETEVRLRDVKTGSDLPDRIAKGLIGGPSFTPDRTGYYYTRNDNYLPRIYYHKMGQTDADKMIFGEGYGKGIDISAGVSEDGKWLLLTVYYGSSADKTELWVQNLRTGGAITPVVRDINARFLGSLGDDTLWVQTNLDAPNSKIVAIDLNRPERANWRTVVPENSKAPLDAFAPIGGKLWVRTLENATSRLRVYNPDGSLLREIALPAEGTVEGPGGHWLRPEAFYTFASFTTPTTVYHARSDSPAQDVFARLKTPVDTRLFEVKQQFFASRDGTQVPMFLVYKKGLKMDGARPVLMTGYGGFNVNETPYFSGTATVWAEHGGVFVSVNMRGGGEYGEAWHQAGMLGHKQNVFDDFIAAGEWLVKNQVTNPNKLAITGGSNGGLLMGAMLTQRPDLFRAVLCDYPLLDMIRYQKFLEASFWIPEYGSSDDPQQFAWLYAYSPYHHVKAEVTYPATLFVTGDADTRVAPLHARKMCALLQSVQTASDRPILLDYDTKGGHSGGESVTKIVADRVNQVGFLFAQLGVTP